MGISLGRRDKTTISSRAARFLYTVFTVVLLCIAVFVVIWYPSIAAAESVEYPSDAGIINVKNFGAKGNGVTDDTAAIQGAIDQTYRYNGGDPNNFRTLYFPNGTYKVSDQISWKRWVTIQGQSKANTVIKLQDHAPGYEAGHTKPVLHCHYSNNESFSNSIHNLTIDTGIKNPGAVGLRYNNHNAGTVSNLIIRSGDGTGSVGLDMTEDEFGPGLIKDVTVEGFDKGVVTVGSVSHATFVNLSLKHQNVVGFENSMPVAIYNLISDNSVPAVRNTSFYLAHFVLVKGKLMGGTGKATAIENSGGFYGRDINVSGYGKALNDKGTLVTGPRINEHFGRDDEMHTLLPSLPKTHLKLPIEAPPSSVVEPISAWVRPSSPSGDASDEIQRAMNSGASTIYFPFKESFTVQKTVTIPATVKRVVGMHNGPSSSFGNSQDYLPVDQPVVRIVGNTSEPLVLDSFFASRWPYNEERPGIEVASNRPVYLKSSGGGLLRLTKGFSGKVWLEDTHVDMRIKGTQKVWAAHYNVENNNRIPNRTYVINDGGTFWCLGMKTEAIALHLDTRNGGRTELLGAFFRDHDVPINDKIPYFSTTDASLSATYLEYDWGGGHARGYQAFESKAGVTQKLVLPRGNHRVGLYRTNLARAWSRSFG